MRQSEENRKIVENLVDRARDGDEDAFGELMQMYYERTYSVVFNLLHNIEDARDVTQQAWIKAWKGLARYRGSSEFFTWIYRIATFAGYDFLRKRGRRKEFGVEDDAVFDSMQDVDAPASKTSRPDHELERQELRTAFFTALDKLSPKHKTVLVLREIEGLSYDEIAEATKSRRGTVMSRLFHARRKVQELMQEQP
jgi:RNA polymerase sigma-70 factor (ECF subfamily)